MLSVSDVSVCYSITGTMSPCYTSLGTIWWVRGNVLLVVHIKSKNWFETQKGNNGYRQPGYLPSLPTSLHCWVWVFDKWRLMGHSPGVEACRVGKRPRNWTCNTLLHTATHCYTLLRTSTGYRHTHFTTAPHCNTMQYHATHCNTLRVLANALANGPGQMGSCGPLWRSKLEVDMGWLRLVGSLKKYVSFSKKPY